MAPSTTKSISRISDGTTEFEIKDALARSSIADLTDRLDNLEIPGGTEDSIARQGIADINERLEGIEGKTLDLEYDYNTECLTIKHMEV